MTIRAGGAYADLACRAYVGHYAFDVRVPCPVHSLLRALHPRLETAGGVGRQSMYPVPMELTRTSIKRGLGTRCLSN